MKIKNRKGEVLLEIDRDTLVGANLNGAYLKDVKGLKK